MGLVLTREQGDTIVIGGTITITLVEVERGKVRLHFDAPKNVTVHRGEVQAKIEDNLRQLRGDGMR